MGDTSPPPYRSLSRAHSPRNPRFPQSNGSSSGIPGSSAVPSAGDEGFVEAPEQNGAMPSLGTDEFARQLDIIDRLQDLGIDLDDVDLPGLAVVGDQSSGKSSVLAGITKIPFPRNTDTCTRFVTKVLKRHDANTTFSSLVTIEPGPDRSPAEHPHLKSFRAQIAPDFSNLPKIIDDASRAIFSGSKQRQTFSGDVLKIEISGKDQQPLEITDIPGLICNGGKDIEVVSNIAKTHISKSRSIILVVVGAGKDLKEQSVLELIDNVSGCRGRAFGIITKPDVAGPGRTERYIELAQNKTKGYEFEWGWHVLRNSSVQELNAGLTWQQRDEIEKNFFHESEWETLLRRRPFQSEEQIVGIASLRTRVVKLLSELNQREIPNVRREIKQKLDAHEERLKELGGSREPAELRERLLASCNRLSQRALDYSRGIYDPRIAKGDMKDESLQLRSRIQELCDEFTWAIHTFGHTYAPDHFPLVPDFDFDEASQDQHKYRERINLFQTPKHISQQDFYREGLRFLRKNRGEELKTYFDPSRLSLLFQQQSEKWGGIAKYFLAEFNDKVEVFLEHALRLEFKSEMDVPSRIWQKFLNDRVTARKNEAQEELKWLLDDLQRPIKTHSLDFQMRTRNLRSVRTYANVNAAIGGEKNRKNQSLANGGAMPVMDPESVSRDVGTYTISQHENNEAARFQDDMLSYYIVSPFPNSVDS
jgi:hypothetical protein